MIVLEPVRNPVGFGVPDFLEFALALTLVLLFSIWSKWLAPFFSRVARHTACCVAVFAIIPVIVRIVLIIRHPIPTPDLYDEFGHLLVADTLRHWRLANPPHSFARFFETFFVIQAPSYSAIYPLGNGLLLALGWSLAGTPWAGVLAATGLFCGLTFWMLRAWITPGWALVGGLLAVMLFGPLNQWTNGYWGGALPAAAGCLVFGSLPRLANRGRIRDGITLGLGLAIHILTRPYETVFLVIAASVYLGFAFRKTQFALRPIQIALVLGLLALGLTALQNKRVTGHWTTLPYALSQYQYGVPAALTFQSDPVPHRQLTPQQQADFRMQSGFLAGQETLGSFLQRLIFRVRYYRFYFYPPMYLALFGFVIAVLRRREFRWVWVLSTCIFFALGVNFFPAFQFHYLAGVVCLFLLMTVKGLERISKRQHGAVAVRFLIVLAIAQFGYAYASHLVDQGGYDLWTSINHGNPERRLAVHKEISAIPGRLVVFVRYWPAHPFQDEWVYNGADIDAQRVVWARDLGDEENQRLLAYYGNRTAMLLEPDSRPPQLSPWVPEPVAPVVQNPANPQAPEKKPLLILEQVR